jgi:aspartyl-tRNA(Asn)/glutamyl-tRNA(Gln) amidotransferase subunit A
VSVAALAARLRAGELSPREAVEGYLERIDGNRHLNAYISVRAEEALAEADAAVGGTAPRGPLWGVPIAVKDVIDVAGSRTTAASEILRDRVAREDAAVITRLRAAGAIVLGKLNLHEFAYGALTTSPHFGPARNPWAPDRVCGGSSGGSGAAAAADLAAGTLGTDTAGSIRIPAAFCGVTGLRPSTGLVSNAGVVPVSWTFDAVGPIARTAEDCRLILEAIAPRFGEELDAGPLRVGLVQSLLDRADPGVAAVVEEAAGVLGAESVEAPVLDRAGLIQQLVMLPEAAAVHLPWLRTRLPDYGADVRARLLAGLLLPATAYPTGLRARRWLEEQVQPLFERYDLLAAPTMPIVPPLIGEDPVQLAGARVPYRLTLIPFNSPWSCLGLPVASVPCGLEQGLPVGLALVGRRGADATVLRAARRFQQTTDWHERRPGSHAGVAS